MATSIQQLLERGSVLCDGAMGTMLYDRGIFINRCYDELNLSQPEMVRTIHEEYLQAGAEIIETNTFGANLYRLRRHGLEDKVAAINLAGVRLARQCVEHIHEKQATEAFVAGAVGPLGVQIAPLGQVTPEEAEAAFAVQMRALAGGGKDKDGKHFAGVDLILLETMTSLAEAEAALRAARSAAPELPVIVMVTVDDDGNCLDGTACELAVEKLEAIGPDGIGCNCSAGPATVLTVIERMRAVTKLPLMAMPNAGLPRVVEGRNIYMCSPEYMASFARKFIKAGATLVGGCCGTTPSHIRAMKSALRAIDSMAKGVEGGTLTAKVHVETKGVPEAPLAERSLIGGRIARGEFVTLVEIVSPKGIDTTKEVAGAAMLHKLGVNAINVPDSPRASARMSAQSLCIQIQQQVGIETVLHYTCRDRNLLSIQSDLLGASSIGLKNILCLTGDPPKLGNYPDATAVFDVDAIGLVNVVRNLNHGLDIGGNPTGASTGFTIGVAANPGVPDVEYEIRRFASKVEAGGEYAITQPVFDMRVLEYFLKRIEEFRIPVIAGIWPLTSLRNAEFMKNDLRVSVPDAIFARMAACSSPDAARAEGIKIAQEMVAESRGMVQGVQVSAPFGKYTAAAEVMQAVL